MVFELYKQHLIEDDKKLDEIYNECKSGKLLCKECKDLCCELMEKFMKDFSKRLEKARKQVKRLKFIKFE